MASTVLTERASRRMRLMESPGHVELQVILSILDVADELIERYRDEHGPACQCQWCLQFAESVAVSGPGIDWELSHLAYSLEIGRSLLRSNLYATKRTCEAVAALMHAEADRIGRGETELWPVPVVVEGR